MSNAIQTTQRSTLTKFEYINPYAAGIDIGAKSHFVAVPTDCDEKPVREFTSFTKDLNSMADWLKKCGVKTVAMESTGVYWIPVYELLEKRGFDVNLVDARQIKNVSGRKTDVSDCQWLQQLHTFGLLNAAFRPKENICALRSYIRQRVMLIQCMASHVQHMQKALTQMNIQIHNAITDITGQTGMKIIRDIVGGERDPKKLAQYRDPRCQSSITSIEAALTGNYRNEHLFALKQALELYDTYKEKINNCDQAIDEVLSMFVVEPPFAGSSEINNTFERTKKRKSKNAALPQFDLEAHLFRLTGVNLLEVPGINSLSALSLIGEIGLDMSQWKSAKQFASWLGLCPNNKISGGKKLSSKTKPSANRAASILRMAASTLYRSSTALGAFLRRLKSRLGPSKAITATAHKLAKIIYSMLRCKAEYKETGQDYYEEKYKERMIKNLKQKAEQFGYTIAPKAEIVTT